MSKNKKQYIQYFIPSYKKLSPAIKESQKGKTYAFCSVCVCDFRISHGGKSDVTKHLDSTKHKENASRPETSQKLEGFIKNSQNFDVIRTECLFTQFLIEHNIPLTAADHAGQLFKKMFPDSDVAKQYACARTKTTSIVSEMADSHQQNMIKILQNSAFSVAIDGSNDSDTKLYPIVVTFYNEDINAIQSSLLSLPNLVGDSTGENIAKLILEELQKFEIPVSNLIAFGADNAAVMMGHKKGVAAFLKNKQPQLIVVGCPCHLINLAAEKAAAVLPVNINNILIDIFYYLQRSAKRKENLRKFQELHGSGMNKILKHVCTRWLSLGKALERLLEQWDSLLSFFQEELSSVKRKEKQAEKSSRGKKRKIHEDIPCQSNYEISIISVEEKIFYFLSSPINKTYCCFLLNAISHFEEFNVKLQSATPKVQCLKGILEDFFKGLLVKFIKPSVIKKFSNLLEVPLKEKENQKCDEDLVIGQDSFKLLEEIVMEEKEQFFLAVRRFFEAACDYILKKFPLTDESLLHAQVADIGKVDESTFTSVRYFVEKLPFLLKMNTEEDEKTAWDSLQKQFTELQCENIPEVENVNSCISILGKMRSADGTLRFDRIAKVLKAVLTIPHSNAECERIFSSIKKNFTQFRSSMSTKSLQNLLLAKSFNQNKCYEVELTEAFLKKAKKATVNSLSK